MIQAEKNFKKKPVSPPEILAEPTEKIFVEETCAK